MNLNQITIPVRNIKKSIEFYSKLGLKLIVHTHENYCRFECPDGEATFSLHRVDKMQEGDGAWIYFECYDLDERVARLQKAGIAFEHGPIDQPWNWREARLKDPDGNLLEISQRPDLLEQHTQKR